MAELSTLARPYAKAIFEYAVAAGDLDGLSKQLATAAAVAHAGKVVEVLSSPSLTTEQQADAFLTVCGDELTAPAKNFIKVLAENKRISLLPEIVSLFDQFKSNREKSVDVEVATVFELEETMKQTLSAALSKKLERDVNLQTTIDKNLIGGVVIRAADIVIDNSIRGRLAKLAETMNA
ncbi:MAG: F-type H+-transporting ATPase subunit delta [Paraglaciecola psychrophila]|jgi:F-type H+-transporting ATPase subunit delta